MLYRKFRRSSFYTDSQYVHLWIHLLMEVNHLPVRLKIKGTDTFIDINEGQFLTSRTSLEKQTGINRSKIERILKALENEQQIEQQTFSKYRVITISNWGKYQKVSSKVSNKRAASEQQVSTNNNDKNEKEVKDCKRFIPPSVSEVENYMQEIGYAGNAQNFVDSNTAKGWVIGKLKTPAKDWKAMVRTWHGNDKKNNPQEEPAKPTQSAADRYKQMGLI